MRYPVTPRNRQNQQDGVSLIEMIVAVLILSIAVVGLFGVFDQAASSVAANRDRLLAGLVARNAAEEIQLGLTFPTEQVQMAGQIWQVSSEIRRTSGGFEEVTISVTSQSGRAGAAIVTYRANGAAP